MGCTSRVEIPIEHAGVVLNNEQVTAEVLKPGKHLVGFGSEVIVYDVISENLDIEFDFLFSDVSRGDIKLIIEFKPIADSLSAFYRKYQSIYVNPAINQLVRKVVRGLFFRYKRSDLSKGEFEKETLKAIKANPAIKNYVEIQQIEIVDLRY